ncbi:MAG: hypothetical protein Q4C12_06075 [Clostridia bacterium]|nr:hypothetical protein [Clostridia bacterium]
MIQYNYLADLLDASPADVYFALYNAAHRIAAVKSSAARMAIGKNNAAASYLALPAEGAMQMTC